MKEAEMPNPYASNNSLSHKHLCQLQMYSKDVIHDYFHGPMCT